MITIRIYKLRKEFREIRWDYYKTMKTLEISLYYWNTIIAFGRIVDWEFIRHTIAIVSRSFKKAEEAMQILKKEGIFKGRKQKHD